MPVLDLMSGFIVELRNAGLPVSLTENLDAKATVMIGDRSHDVIGAKQNQVFAIGITYGYGSIEELNNHGADAIAHSPQEILPLIPIKSSIP